MESLQSIFARQYAKIGQANFTGVTRDDGGHAKVSCRDMGMGYLKFEVAYAVTRIIRTIETTRFQFGWGKKVKQAGYRILAFAYHGNIGHSTVVPDWRRREARFQDFRTLMRYFGPLDLDWTRQTRQIRRQQLLCLWQDRKNARQAKRDPTPNWHESRPR